LSYRYTFAVAVAVIEDAVIAFVEVEEVYYIVVVVEQPIISHTN
jgi:hypothetical protein